MDQVHIEDAGSRFIDEENLHLALRDDSPAYSITGSRRNPFARIGPASD